MAELEGEHGADVEAAAGVAVGAELGAEDAASLDLAVGDVIDESLVTVAAHSSVFGP